MEDKVTFTIEGKKAKELGQFAKSHSKCKGCASGEKFCFSFIPNLLGVSVKVSCSCGKSIDLTDWESW